MDRQLIVTNNIFFRLQGTIQHDATLSAKVSSAQKICILSRFSQLAWRGHGS